MKRFMVLLACVFVALHVAAEGTLTGTYTTQGRQGAVTLVLNQDADGSVTGSMSGNGAKMVIQAKMQDGKAIGVMTSPGEQGGAFFMAQKDGADVAVVMADVGANGQPNEATARRITFKAAAAEAPANPPAGDKPAPVNPLAGEDPYVGTFKGDAGKLVVEIAAAQGGYAGTINLEDQKFTFKGAVKDGQLAGTFESQGNTFDFTAAANGNTLTLKAGSTTYLLEKQRKAVNPLEKRGPANPLEKKPDGGAAAVAPATPGTPGAGAKPADAADDKWVPLARGKVYKHPTGGMLRYPQDWQVKEADEALQLIPPNQGANPEAIYLVTAEDAEGITRPDDPKLIQAVELQVAQFAPLLKRVGQVESVKSGSNAGAGLVWEATGENGQTFRANLYVTIIKGQAVCLCGLGLKPKVMQDDKILREIFSTFAWGAAEIDRDLVGVWHYWSYSSSGLGGPGMSSTETRRACALKEDGTFTWEGNTEGYISATNKNALGEVTSSASAVGNKGTGAKGTWAAADGKLYLTHDDGTYVAVKYQIKGERGNRFLYIDNGGKKPQEWSEKRVNF